jgi:hypothetical protein
MTNAIDPPREIHASAHALFQHSVTLVLFREGPLYRTFSICTAKPLFIFQSTFASPCHTIIGVPVGKSEEIPVLYSSRL